MIKLGRTSEAVALGHPDIVTDTIVDSLVDLALKQNKDARCGFEAISAKDEVIIRGEVGGTELKKPDVDDVIRRVVKFIGYDEIDGFDWQTLKTNIFINNQSGDIAQGVVAALDENSSHVKGYGDNGIYFGHYTDETPLGLIAPFFITKELMAIHSFMDSEVRRKWGIRPDAKCQFTESIGKDNPGTLVFCVSHDEGADVASYVNAVVAKFCDTYPQFSDMLFNSEKFINPTGRFVVCGPAGDCGTVGRKLTATTYGGVIPIGGGALCGKCPTKSDRSLQLMARYLARKISEKYELNEVKVSLSTGIGLAEPTSLKVEASRPEVNTEAEHWVLSYFDLTPSGVIKELDLKNIEYVSSAMNGHFGVSPFMPSDLARKSFTWER